jgi:endonuclease/exonuclease/phosphatase family metal-dependent hydrolase
VLVNRDLFYEFAALLSAADWDAALLQEVPPRWVERLAEATGAEARATLTSRNWMRPFTGLVARFRPHLIGSWEGGCNLILVRRGRPGATVEAHAKHVLTRRPERRVVSTVRTGSGLVLANLHASTGRAAAADVLEAARAASDFAGGAPLVLGGDFNVRPASSPVFAELEERYGFTGATSPKSIDHLLVARAKILEPAEAWPDQRRDVPARESGLKLRLSDHAPVLSRIAV